MAEVGKRVFVFSMAEHEGKDIFNVGGAIELAQIDYELFVLVFLQCFCYVRRASQFAGKKEDGIIACCQAIGFFQERHHKETVG